MKELQNIRCLSRKCSNLREHTALQNVEIRPIVLSTTDKKQAQCKSPRLSHSEVKTKRAADGNKITDVKRYMFSLGLNSHSKPGESKDNTCKPFI